MSPALFLLSLRALQRRVEPERFLRVSSSLRPDTPCSEANRETAWGKRRRTCCSSPFSRACWRPALNTTRYRQITDRSKCAHSLGNGLNSRTLMAVMLRTVVGHNNLDASAWTNIVCMLQGWPHWLTKSINLFVTTHQGCHFWTRQSLRQSNKTNRQLKTLTVF